MSAQFPDGMDPEGFFSRARAKKRFNPYALAAVALLHLGIAYLFISQDRLFGHGQSRIGTAPSEFVADATIYPASPKPSQAAREPRKVAKHDAPQHADLQEDKLTPPAPAVIGSAAAGSQDNGGAQSEPSSAIATAQGAMTASNSATSDFQQRLLARIQPYVQYPSDSPQSRPQGVVEVLFTMGRTGIIIGIWVKQTSGYTALDKAAVASVLKAQPLPPIPGELPDPLNVTLPITFGSPS